MKNTTRTKIAMFLAGCGTIMLGFGAKPFFCANPETQAKSPKLECSYLSTYELLNNRGTNVYTQVCEVRDGQNVYGLTKEVKVDNETNQVVEGPNCRYTQIERRTLTFSEELTAPSTSIEILFDNGCDENAEAWQMGMQTPNGITYGMRTINTDQESLDSILKEIKNNLSEYLTEEQKENLYTK